MRSRRRHLSRLSWVALLALFLVLSSAGAASAHALLLSSNPIAGERLGITPGDVTLVYSEALDAGLSRVTVTDPTGLAFPGAVKGTDLVVPLATNVPGQYTVTWTAVSLSDGHTTAGSFYFTVESTAAPGGAAAGSQTSSPGLSGFAIALLRALQLVALFVSIGLLLMRRVGGRAPRIEWVGPRARRGARATLAVALASATALMLLEAIAAVPSITPSEIWIYLTTGVTGWSRVLLFVLEDLALFACVSDLPVWPFLAGAVVAFAGAGHAAGVHPSWFGVAVDAVHIGAAGLWAGGILSLLVLRPPGGWRGEQGRALLDRFTPVALAAFLVTVGTGIVQFFQYVGGLHALVSTSYGAWLIVKMVLIAGMVPLSFLAWRRRVVRPRVESAIAVCVLVAASFLASYAVPTHSAAHATIVTGGPHGSALPKPGGLTLGDHAGATLVGLTLTPARPGANEALVYLQSLSGDARGLAVTMSVAGRSVPLSVCGDSCRKANVTLSGGEVISVAVGGPNGGTASFTIPTLPAPGGSALLDKMQNAMHALHTYTVEETLSTGLTTLNTRYLYEAPNRLQVTSLSGPGAGAQTVFVGAKRYTRAGPGQNWLATQAVPIPVPSFIWDFFRPFQDPLVVGSARIGGVATKIVAFYGSSGGLPVWFRLWIDTHGVVRQADMRAEGHFMDQSFSGFDAPTTVSAPVAGAVKGPQPATPGVSPSG